MNIVMQIRLLQMKITLLCTGLFFLSAVQAKEANMVIYAGGGESEMDSTAFEASDTGFKFANGFRASEYSGVEVSCLSSGEMHDK